MWAVSLRHFKTFKHSLQRWHVIIYNNNTSQAADITTTEYAAAAAGLGRAFLRRGFMRFKRSPSRRFSNLFIIFWSYILILWFIFPGFDEVQWYLHGRTHALLYWSIYAQRTLHTTRHVGVGAVCGSWRGRMQSAASHIYMATPDAVVGSRSRLDWS